LIKDETSRCSVGRTLSSSDGITIFVGRNRGVEEVTRSSTEDEVNISFNVGLESEHVTRDIQCILVSIDLTAVHEGIFAALDREAKRSNVLLGAIVVPEVDIVGVEVVTSRVDGSGIHITSSTLRILAIRLLDGNLVLVVIISRVRVPHEDG
jgi:hypothetical protein